ncbi:hypothetical protein NQ317_005326 [Molorchus minor]|uniref:Uncharacterized protein n=1 Tax=Molorchus minor TaxID=1323400 RepID=A0ABQ9JZL5_9CUCU|nr:hypothetical protein NQ317_005326 [Molorchus minor]
MGLLSDVPSAIDSKLENVFYAAVTKSADLKTFGNEKCYECLIEEIKDLEINGIEIQNGDTETVIVHFILGLVIGDNLGLNSFLNFTKSFSSNFFCRFCPTSKTDTHELNYEDDALTRTVENYDLDAFNELRNVKYEPHFLAYEVNPSDLSPFSLISVSDDHIVGPPITLIKTARGKQFLPPPEEIELKALLSEWGQEDLAPELIEPEADAESCLRALKFDNLTADQFDSTWKACCNFRLQCLKSKNTAEIMEKWPFYKSPSGYRLIDIDFKAAFENRDGLLCEWDEKWETIVSFLMIENHVKDRNVKVILENLKNNTAISENGRNAALVWALHGYLVPTTKIIKKDAATGKKSTTKFTIKDSQESVVFIGATQQEVEDHISHLKRIKTSIQPSVYGIGENIYSIEQIFVLF